MKFTSIITAFTLIVGISTALTGNLAFSLYGVFAPFRLLWELACNYQPEYTIPLIGFTLIWAILSSVFTIVSKTVKWF